MRLWASFVPGFSDLAWTDMKALRIKFWRDSEDGKDCTPVIEALRNAPRTFSGNIRAVTPIILEGETIKDLERFSRELVESARLTYNRTMAKMKRPD